MPNVVFKDPLHEAEFNRKGYVKVPFLNSAEIAHLKQLFFDTIAESGGPKTAGDVDFENKADITYDFTFIDRNEDYKRKVFDIITKAFQKKADQYLDNYTPIIANYIRKKEGGGEVPMHQNWAFVDEEKYTSVSIWVPLVDSNEENGTLQMVNGSHKRFGKLRGPMIPWELEAIKEKIISMHLTPMHVKAGEGIILDDSIVHYSNINKTPGLRLAIQLIMIPAASGSIHYHLDRNVDKTKVQVLETDLDFYMGFHPWLKPKGKSVIKTKSYAEKKLSYDEFLKALKGARFDQPPAGIQPDSVIPHHLEKFSQKHLTDKMKDLSITHLTNTVAPLFKDAALQAAFEKDGYVKINLLNADQVKDLKHYYQSLQHDHIGEYGFHISLENKNADYINGVFKKLFDAALPELDRVLDNYKAFTASYVIKEAGLQNIVPPHQDWTFVDEALFSSATVWIPLMDVNKNNGALGIIKGSHRVFNYPRASPSPQAKSLLSDHAFNLFPYVEVIDLKAGEALIFNNRTVHASPPNTSGITRIAAGIGITQKNAPLLHYYQRPGAEENIDVYAVDEAFFLSHNNSKMSAYYNKGLAPEGLSKINTFRKAAPALSKAEITAMVSAIDGVSMNTGLMNELAGLYHYNADGTPKTGSNNLSMGNNMATVENTESVNRNIQPPDTRTFFQKYTAANIVAEIKYRLKKV